MAECRAAWTDDRAERSAVWRRFREAPEPPGYDFAAIFPGGPESEGPGFLRLDPWRVRTHRVIAGEAPRVWCAPAPG